MATAAVSFARERSSRFRSTTAVLLLSAVAAGSYAWMRLPAAERYRAAFAAVCRQAHLQPQDWPCRVSSAGTLTAFLGGSLLIGLALAVPCTLLAATGRRATALIPLIVALAGLLVADVTTWFTDRNPAHVLLGVNEMFGGSGGREPYWQAHAAQAVEVDIVLLSIPAVAIMLALRRPRREPGEARPARHATWVALAVCAGAAVVVAWAAPRLHLFPRIFDTEVLTPAAVMAAFGMLLGTDRRWWPWVLAPVAVLLSLGPAMAVMAIPSLFVAFTWFGAAVPFAVIGFVASLWRPLALRLSGGAREEAVERPARVRRLRPGVVLNAGAAGLLVVSMLAYRFDPLPVQIAIALPTFLGERQFAQDVRAKMNLEEAIGAMDAYHAARDTYRGFDAATGETAVPELAWSERATGENLVVAVAAATASRAQVVAASGSGKVFCVQALADDVGGSTVTYGVGDGLGEARTNCGDTPWTPRATAMFPMETMCDGVVNETIVICRAVQHLLRETLDTPAA